MMSDKSIDVYRHLDETVGNLFDDGREDEDVSVLAYAVEFFDGVYTPRGVYLYAAFEKRVWPEKDEPLYSIGFLSLNNSMTARNNVPLEPGCTLRGAIDLMWDRLKMENGEVSLVVGKYHPREDGKEPGKVIIRSSMNHVDGLHYPYVYCERCGKVYTAKEFDVDYDGYFSDDDLDDADYMGIAFCPGCGKEL